MSAPAIQGRQPDARVPLALLALVTPVLLLTLAYCRAGRLNWLLEVAPALLGYLALAATYRRMRLSNFCKEVLLRATPLRRGGWLTFIVLSIVMAIAAGYELIEWASTYVFAGDVGQALRRTATREIAAPPR